MTAEPSGHVMWTPDPIRQRQANYTLEDLLSLPEDAPRVELRDGVVIVVPSPSVGHQNIGNLLWLWFRQNAPAEYEMSTAVGIAVGVQDTLEPDVVLLRRPVDLARHYLTADQVAIAVEVVSPGTRRRDRLEKPELYAAAGVQQYWRIEQNPVHVFAYELVGSRYELIADSAEELELRKPFDARLRIRDITP